MDPITMIKVARVGIKVIMGLGKEIKYTRAYEHEVEALKAAHGGENIEILGQAEPSGEICCVKEDTRMRNKYGSHWKGFSHTGNMFGEEESSYNKLVDRAKKILSNDNEE